MFMASVAFNCAVLSVVVNVIVYGFKSYNPKAWFILAYRKAWFSIDALDLTIHNELGSHRGVLNDTQHAVFNKTSHFEWCEVATAPINYLGQ
jgi:hypothetical protein